MSESLFIRYQEVDADEVMTDEARSILEASGLLNPNLFLYENWKDNPNILAIGYQGSLAVMAVVVSEAYVPRVLPESDYTKFSRSFLDVPHLTIQALATVQACRQHGHGSQAIRSAHKLASENGYHHLQVFAAGKAEKFWINRGFIEAPYGLDSWDLVRESSLPIGEVTAHIEVDPAVQQRLKDFSSQDLSASGQRLR